MMVMQKQMNSKQAFTLAETLITLMVVGVLAVLTIPSMIQSFEKMMLRSQFKNQFANISQAFYLTRSQGNYRCNYIDSIAYSSGCKVFYEDFFKNLKVVKECKGSALADGCIPNYSIAETNPGCTSFNKSNIDNINYARVLSDKTIIFGYGQDTFPMIGIDINGLSPPNERGKDIFSLAFLQETNGNVSIRSYIVGCLNYSPYQGYFNSLSDIYK